MKILLIAGHGGTPYDPGAAGCGYTEAVETRRMANAVALGAPCPPWLEHILEITRDAVDTAGDITGNGEGKQHEDH